MNKKLTAIVSCGLTALISVSVLAPTLITHSEFNENGTYAITDDDKAILIGVDNPDEYFLGIASQFSVFVQGDFKAEGSDCEGRLAAGGNANLGESTPSYSVGAKLDPETTATVAQVIVGGNILQHFEPNGKNFVAPLNADVQDNIMNYMSNGLCKVYEGELFDFDEQFALLNQRSIYLKNLDENAELEIDEYYKQQWTVTGNNENLNVINLTPEQYEVFTNDNKYIELNVHIPLGSYLVINVPGTEIELPSTTVKVDYTDDDSDEVLIGENLPVLYNLSDATQFKYSGSIQGSTLAPNADASGDEGGHVAGMTIAKSFDGGIQFGYSTFNPKVNKMSTTEETTTTTEATTTTTEETTTTTEATTTTTKETTTTTEETTTTTEETTTTTEETTTTTEETTTTTEETTTTTEETTATTSSLVMGGGDSRTTSTTETTTTEEITTTTEETTTITEETTATTSSLVMGGGDSRTTSTTETTTTTEETTTTTEETTTTTEETTTTTTDTTTTSTTTTTTTTTTATTTKNATSNNESPKTGDKSIGALIALAVSSLGTAFALRKKED